MAKQPDSILVSAMNAARANRFGDVVMIIMDTMVYTTPSMEWQMASQWGRAKVSLGNKNKDRNALLGKLEHVIARSGSGIATKGTNKKLQEMVGVMEQSGFDIKDWVLPPTLWESIEIKKKKKDDEAEAAQGEAAEVEQKPEEPKAP